MIGASEIMIEIYAAESTILRTEKLVKATNEKDNEAQVAMAKLTLYNAVDKAQTSGKEAINYFSTGDENRMMKMGLKRFTKYTNEPNVIELRNTIADKIILENKYCF